MAKWKLVHHDSVPTHTSMSVQQFMAKNKMCVITPPSLLSGPCYMWLLVFRYEIEAHWKDIYLFIYLFIYLLEIQRNLQQVL